MQFLRSIVRALRGKEVRQWRDAEYFDPVWKQRIGQMAKLLPSGEQMKVMDLGCGKMWLKEFLPDRFEYIPVDYTDRGEGTILCDFNNLDFPERDVDVAFVSGCMEYVENFSLFIVQISKHAEHCLISYCSTDYTPDIAVRSARNWVNHLGESEIVTLFRDVGFELVESISQENTIFLFSKKAAVY